MLRGPIGTTATVTNYTDDGTVDKHGDPTREADTTSTGAPVLFRQPPQTEATDQDSPAGTDATYDALVFIPDSYDVHEAGQGSRYPTRITDDDTGRDYDVVGVWDEKNGTYRCAVKEV